MSALNRSNVTSTPASLAGRDRPSERSDSAYHCRQSRRHPQEGWLAQQLGEPAVGERLAAGLAGGAVLQRGVGEADLAHGVAADRTGQPGTGVHLQPRALLAL